MTRNGRNGSTPFRGTTFVTNPLYTNKLQWFVLWRILEGIDSYFLVKVTIFPAKYYFMVEKMPKVSNPLTIIAIFAGVSEISGTVVLPFLKEENQAIFIWFLMIFPCLLVLFFFLVLLFKHTVLYAPSDFLSDESFLKVVQISGNKVQNNNQPITF